VAGAASVGVFVSFASLFIYMFGMFLQPLTETFSWSREAVAAGFGIAAMTVAVCSPPLGMLLDRHAARRIIAPALAILGCVRFAGAPDAAAIASLCGVPRPRHRGECHGADGLHAHGVELVRRAARCRARGDAVWRLGGGRRAAADSSGPALYGLTWTACAIAGAIGPVLMGRAFDATGWYEALLVRLAIGTLVVAGLMLCLPGYETARSSSTASAAARYQPQPR